MGKHWKQKMKLKAEERQRRAEAEGNVKKPKPENYPTIVKENENFEKYYKLQKICPDEDFEKFMDYMRRSLPATFRITGFKSEAKTLLHRMQKSLIADVIRAEAQNDENSGQTFPLPWYPENLGWQLSLSRIDIRKHEANVRLHNFLISETECGNISRQEAVSMIPPLALDVEPHHKVLDMCAAPGSKTAQIIEMLHADENKNPTGYVVANDVDNKRCYMLVHQGKRFSSPAFIVTNHDAGAYPNVYTTENGTRKKLQFDRVLCDVPCSGDGTLRKNVDVWGKWNTGNAYHLNKVQCTILKRGLELLKTGGQLVYSTCSLNPIENEAVIHRILKECQGSVELRDINLPGLKSSPGISTWIPFSKDMDIFAKAEDITPRWKSVILPNMYPPSAEEAEQYHLDKCVRVLPHFQDTGGFFISLLVKTKPLPWEKVVAEEPKPEPTISYTNESGPKHNDRPPLRKHRKLCGFKEDPFVFMTNNEPVWTEVRRFYGLDEDLKDVQCLTRNTEGNLNKVYTTTSSVRDFVSSNDSHLKIINIGVRTFCKTENKWMDCPLRLSQEGIHTIFPFIKKRKVNVTKNDILLLLMSTNDEKPPATTCFSEKTQEQLVDIERGTLLLIVDCQDVGSPNFSLVIVGWKGDGSMRAYISKNERMHYLRLFGVDTSKYEINKFKDKAAANEEKTDNDPSNGAASTSIQESSSQMK